MRNKSKVEGGSFYQSRRKLLPFKLGALATLYFITACGPISQPTRPDPFAPANPSITQPTPLPSPVPAERLAPKDGVENPEVVRLEDQINLLIGDLEQIAVEYQHLRPDPFRLDQPLDFKEIDKYCRDLLSQAYFYSGNRLLPSLFTLTHARVLLQQTVLGEIDIEKASQRLKRLQEVTEMNSMALYVGENLPPMPEEQKGRWLESMQVLAFYPSVDPYRNFKKNEPVDGRPAFIEQKFRSWLEKSKSLDPYYFNIETPLDLTSALEKYEINPNILTTLNLLPVEASSLQNFIKHGLPPYIYIVGVENLIKDRIALSLLYYSKYGQLPQEMLDARAYHTDKGKGPWSIFEGDEYTDEVHFNLDDYTLGDPINIHYSLYQPVIEMSITRALRGLSALGLLPNQRIDLAHSISNFPKDQITTWETKRVVNRETGVFLSTIFDLVSQMDQFEEAGLNHFLLREKRNLQLSFAAEWNFFAQGIENGGWENRVIDIDSALIFFSSSRIALADFAVSWSLKFGLGGLDAQKIHTLYDFLDQQGLPDFPAETALRIVMACQERGCAEEEIQYMLLTFGLDGDFHQKRLIGSPTTRITNMTDGKFSVRLESGDQYYIYTPANDNGPIQLDNLYDVRQVKVGDKYKTFFYAGPDGYYPVVVLESEQPFSIPSSNQSVFLSNSEIDTAVVPQYNEQDYGSLSVNIKFWSSFFDGSNGLPVGYGFTIPGQVEVLRTIIRNSQNKETFTRQLSQGYPELVASYDQMSELERFLALYNPRFYMSSADPFIKRELSSGDSRSYTYLLYFEALGIPNHLQLSWLQ